MSISDTRAIRARNPQTGSLAKPLDQAVYLAGYCGSHYNQAGRIYFYGSIHDAEDPFIDVPTWPRVEVAADNDGG